MGYWLLRVIGYWLLKLLNDYGYLWWRCVKNVGTRFIASCHDESRPYKMGKPKNVSAHYRFTTRLVTVPCSVVTFERCRQFALQLEDFLAQLNSQ